MKHTLIKLKRIQGKSDKHLRVITTELDKVDDLLKEADIRNWLHHKQKK